MTTKPILIFNAPPHSGKDYLCNKIKEMDLNGIFPISFKAPLLQMVSGMLGYPDFRSFMELYNTEGWKDSTIVHGLSVRQWMIDISENYVKRRLGENYFGRLAAASILNNEKTYGSETTIFTDGGFEEEVGAVAGAFPDRVVVVRIHRDGCSFDGDSRSFLPDSDKYFTIDIDNNGTAWEFTDELITKLKELGFPNPFRFFE